MGKKIKSVATVSNVFSPLGSITDPAGIFTKMDQGLGLGPKDPARESAGPAPTAPEYESMRGTDGALKDIYKFDPTKSDAFGQMHSQAMSTGPSAWANMQTQKQGLEEANLRDMANKQGLQSMNQGNAMLARTGGLSSGASRLNARDNARSMMLAGQDISRGGMMDRLGISQADEATRQQLRGQVADTQLSAQEKNLGMLTGDVQGKQKFDLDRYAQQMQAWGAANTANAQAHAASQTKKGKK